MRLRSSPAPVSMLGFGSVARVPSGRWSNCMKTRFQISMYRSESVAGPPSGPNSGPRSQKISDEGPHGPVSPMRQKFGSPSRWIRSGGNPTTSRQIRSASSSSSCTVTHNRPGSTFSTSM